MKTAILAASLFLLSGCASFDFAQNAIAGKSSQAADELQQTAEWTLCNGISVGAWRRAYAGNDARASGWAALCNQPGGLPQ